MSLSKLEHIIRPRHDTLFLPLENKIEISRPDKVIIPENKTCFLKTKVGDIVIPIKTNQSQELKTDNIKPIASSSENISATKIEAKQTPDSFIDNIITIASSSENISATKIETKQTPGYFTDNIKSITLSSETEDNVIATNSLKYNGPIKNIPVEITINDQLTEEKTEKQRIVQPILKLCNKSYTDTSININLELENKITEPIDVDSTLINDSSNKIDGEDDEYLKMKNDFVCD